MNKWNIIEFLIVIMCLLFILSLFLTCTTQNEQIDVKVKEYNHEFITTSRYNFFTNKYKIISKCRKCGWEV